MIKSLFTDKLCGENAFFKPGERRRKEVSAQFAFIGGKGISEISMYASLRSVPSGYGRILRSEEVQGDIGIRQGKYRILRLEELLPFGFGSEYL